MARTVKPTYKEPTSYFNEDMKKAVEEWKRTHKEGNSSKTEKKGK